MILRLLNGQGIAGLILSASLAILLLFQVGETRHWKKQSSAFEQLYANEKSAFAATVVNYRAAAERARAADAAAAQRTRAEQASINERIANDYEDRLADARARARAQRMRLEAGHPASDSGGSGEPPVPRLPASAGRNVETARENGLPADDALIATEQAIQLDELIRWVKAQADVDPNADPAR
jgi:hypothetical protein